MYTFSQGSVGHVHGLPSCSKYFLKRSYFPPRLRSLTAESSVIVAALQKSKTGLLEISEDKTKVRRSPNKPLPEVNDEYKDALKHKSVYIVRFFFFFFSSSRRCQDFVVHIQIYFLLFFIVSCCFTHSSCHLERFSP